MAGEVCLNVAVRNAEVGAMGTIPLQAAELIPLDRNNWSKDPLINSALINPGISAFNAWKFLTILTDLVVGLCHPETSLRNKNLVWHIYSGSAFGVFDGDLEYCRLSGSLLLILTDFCRLL
jgi:hypothetical protein